MPVIWSVVVIAETFAERLAVCMNAIAEIFTGFDSAGVVKLPDALRQSIERSNAVKTRNDYHKKGNGGKNSGKEKRREFIVKKLSEKNAETRIKRAYSVP